jgi:hypothetical protein
VSFSLPCVSIGPKKGKVIAVCTLKACRGSRGIGPFILNRVADMWASRHPPAALRPGRVPSGH